MQCMHNDITYDLQRGGAYIYECCEHVFLATLPKILTLELYWNSHAFNSW